VVSARRAGPGGSSYSAFVARCKRGRYAGGPKRAAFWRALGFPNLVRARAAKARKRESGLKERHSKCEVS
jgi:hypothetical protein